MKSNYTPLFLAVSAAIISYTAASPASALVPAHRDGRQKTCRYPWTY
jgi:hypothetical protein